MCSLVSLQFLLQVSDVLPFKQISNIGTTIAAEANKRKGSRFVINPTFPIKAMLSLIDRSDRPRPGTKSSFRPAPRRNHPAGGSGPDGDCPVGRNVLLDFREGGVDFLVGQRALR